QRYRVTVPAAAGPPATSSASRTRPDPAPRARRWSGAVIGKSRVQRGLLRVQRLALAGHGGVVGTQDLVAPVGQVLADRLLRQSLALVLDPDAGGGNRGGVGRASGTGPGNGPRRPPARTRRRLASGHPQRHPARRRAVLVADIGLAFGCGAGIHRLGWADLDHAYRAWRGGAGVRRCGDRRRAAWFRVAGTLHHPLLLALAVGAGRVADGDAAVAAGA